MQHRPVGTVTFLFTDMEGSSRAWDSYPSETRAALQRHDEIAAREVEAHNGTIILDRGEGDSIFAVFTIGSDAVAAALDIQRAFQKETRPSHVPVRVRMAIHTGEAAADYRGPDVNRAARLRAIGHGEQFLFQVSRLGSCEGCFLRMLRSSIWVSIDCETSLRPNTCSN
jgi:class 3 adenylate cyclase